MLFVARQPHGHDDVSRATLLGNIVRLKTHAL
jgi:hypothetical protein